jgi:hypothetical protein
VVTLYTTVRATDLPRILATGFTEGDEVDEPGNPLIGVMLAETPEPWEDNGPPEWVMVAVLLDATLEDLAQYTIPEDSYWWIPAHRLDGALIRHVHGPLGPLLT